MLEIARIPAVPTTRSQAAGVSQDPDRSQRARPVRRLLHAIGSRSRSRPVVAHRATTGCGGAIRRACLQAGVLARDQPHCFFWWNHWPVSMIPSDGKQIHMVDGRPSSTSVPGNNRRPTPDKGVNSAATLNHESTNCSRGRKPKPMPWRRPFERTTVIR